MAKTLFRSGPSSDNHLQELANWVNSLPAYLQLQIGSSQTRHLDRDVYQLHLPYLTTVIILHLKRSEHSLPQALPPAILAASCIARILRDVLARGNARFLMAITCWYAGTAFIPLLQASRVSHFAQEASECLDILERTVDQLQSMWGTANVIRQGFERLRATASELPVPNTSAEGGLIQVQDRRQTSDTFDWTRLFPFATRDTNGIADRLLADREPGSMTEVHPPGDLLFHEMLMSQFDNIFVDTPDYNFDFMTNL